MGTGHGEEGKAFGVEERHRAPQPFDASVRDEGDQPRRGGHEKIRGLSTPASGTASTSTSRVMPPTLPATKGKTRRPNPSWSSRERPLSRATIVARQNRWHERVEMHVTSRWLVMTPISIRRCRLHQREAHAPRARGKSPSPWPASFIVQFVRCAAVAAPLRPSTPARNPAFAAASMPPKGRFLLRSQKSRLDPAGIDPYADEATDGRASIPGWNLVCQVLWAGGSGVEGFDSFRAR